MGNRPRRLKLICVTSDDVTVRRAPKEPGYRIVVPTRWYDQAPNSNVEDLQKYCKGLLTFTKKEHEGIYIGWVPLHGVPKQDRDALVRRVLRCFMSGQVHFVREDREKRKPQAS